jgi:DNA-binding transcriptional LysR family regulator
MVVVASPGYLKRAGTPETLNDLEQRECIQFEMPSNGRNLAWVFTVNAQDSELVTRGGTVCSGDVLAGVTLARNGAGLFQTYRYIVEKDLQAGSLVEVLKSLGGRSRPFILLYPHARHMSLRVRTFAEFLAAELGPNAKNLA